METSALLRLVSEGTRHSLLERLRQGEKTVTELVAALGDEQSNISHHLGALREAGLVAATRRGRQQVYRLADPEVARVLGEVAALAAHLEQVAYLSRLGLPAGSGFHGYG